MARARWALVLVLFASLVAAQEVKTTTYRFVAIQYPGAVRTALEGINNKGDIVGAYLDTLSVWHGFTIKNGKMTRLDYPDHATYLRGINSRRQIVGTYGTMYYSVLLMGLNIFTWDRARGFTVLLPSYTPPPGEDIWAEGLNDTGTVVGMAFESPSRWQDGTVVDFCPEGWSFGYVRIAVKGVSNSGTIVGSGKDRTTWIDGLPVNFHDALVQDPSGNCAIFNTGIDANVIHLNAISTDDAYLAGDYDPMTANAPTSPLGFVWHSGTHQDIAYPGSQQTVVNGVNAAGVLVGTATVDGVVIGFVAIPPPQDGRKSAK